jgi:hypothetical protein
MRRWSSIGRSPILQVVFRPLLALALGALPLLAPAQEPPPIPQPVDDEEPPVYVEHVPRWRLSVWGGAGVLMPEGDSLPLAGLQGSYAFDFMDVGLLVQGYHLGGKANEWDSWLPGVLARFEQRFETRRGLEATLAFGLGASRLVDWEPWFQFALGLRYSEGPLTVGGELGVEQSGILRLAANGGVRF